MDDVCNAPGVFPQLDSPVVFLCIVFGIAHHRALKTRKHFKIHQILSSKFFWN
jgi:hypothetical protein